jgi:uncharacterized membrane protein YidH (DUF202 family)
MRRIVTEELGRRPAGWFPRAVISPLSRRECVVHEPGPEGAVKLIGILLIVFGVVALALGGISYTRREKVVDLGPIQATTEQRKTIPLSPIVGLASVAGGIVLVVVGSKTRV